MLLLDLKKSGCMGKSTEWHRGFLLWNEWQKTCQVYHFSLNSHFFVFLQDSSPNTDSPHSKKLNQASLTAVRGLYFKNCESKQYQRLQKSREELPVFQYGNQILEQLNKHSVILIAGETGCGKSTQIPHYVLKVRNIDILCVICMSRKVIICLPLDTFISLWRGTTLRNNKKGRHKKKDLKAKKCVT